MQKKAMQEIETIVESLNVNQLMHLDALITSLPNDTFFRFDCIQYFADFVHEQLLAKTSQEFIEQWEDEDVEKLVEALK